MDFLLNEIQWRKLIIVVGMNVSTKRKKRNNGKKNEMSEWWFFSSIAVTFSYFIELNHRDEQFVYNDKSCNRRQTHVFEMWMHIWFGLGITTTTFCTIDWSKSITINNIGTWHSFTVNVTSVLFYVYDICSCCLRSHGSISDRKKKKQQKYEQFCDRENAWRCDSGKFSVAITNFTKMPIILRCSSIMLQCIILICPA